MIITSSQQIEERLNPSKQMDIKEFELITMLFGSFVCIAKNKKLNYINFLKILVDDHKAREIYCNIVDDSCFQNVVRCYLNSTPNSGKKIFRSKFSKSHKNNTKCSTKK